MMRRYALVRQHDQSDCGAAALATVALHHRRPIGLQQMRDLAGTDRDRHQPARAWCNAAEKLGFSAKGVKGPYEALPQVPLPAVAHVQTEEGLGHFVVLHRVRKGSVVVADPARGVQTTVPRRVLPALDELPAHGGTGARSVPRGRGPACRSGPGVASSACCGPTPRFSSRPSVCALLMTVLGVSTSYFIQHLVDSVLVRSEGRLLNALGVGMVLIVVFRTLFGLLRQYLVAHVGRKVDLALISGYARHILQAPPAVLRDAAGRRDPVARQRRGQGARGHQRHDADRRGRWHARGPHAGGPLGLRRPAGAGGDGLRPAAGGQRDGAPPRRAAALPRGDGERRRALGPPGRGRLRRGDGQGLRGRAGPGRGGRGAAGQPSSSDSSPCRSSASA